MPASPVPALLLCAGLGTRLDPITRLVAKPAVPLGGRTLVERIVDWLVRQDVVDIVINLHHRPETITGVIGDGAHLGARVRYSWENPVLGSAGGPRRASSLLDATRFFIINGDSLCDVPLAAMAAAHASSGADVTLAVVPHPAPARYGGLSVEADGTVTGTTARGAADNRWHFVGVQIANADVFDGLDDDAIRNSIGDWYRERQAAGRLRMHTFECAAPFVDVGTPADYLDAALGLAGGTNACEPGASIAPDAHVGRTLVWPGATVGPRATLEECVVLDVAVPAGFEARRALLAPASLVRDADEATIVRGVACFALST